jgi:hypothetical protein
MNYWGEEERGKGRSAIISMIFKGQQTLFKTDEEIRV